MLGAEGVTSLLVARFTAALPAKIVELRARYGITARDLPDALVLAAEPEDTKLELARFPVVFLVERDTPRVAEPNKSHDGSAFRIDYNLSVAYFVRDASIAATTAQRRRLGLAVREVLLERPFLRADDRQGITLDVGGWLERYTAAAAAGGGGVVGGGEFAGQWTAQEWLPTPTAVLGFVPHGYAETVVLKGAPGTPDIPTTDPPPVQVPDPGNDDPDLPL